MGYWWIDDWVDRPYKTWFYAKRTGEDAPDPNGIDPQVFNTWPKGYYWFYKIPASGGHNEQLAFRTDEDKIHPTATHGTIAYYAGYIYIITYPNDTPNWGSTSSFVAIGPPCDNWYANIWETELEYTTRNQSGELKAAIRGNRQLTGKIKTIIAQTYKLDHNLTATIARTPQLLNPISVAIKDDVEKIGHQKAAIRGEVELDSPISAAIAHDFDLPSNLLVAIQAHPLLWNRYRAAIKGENGIEGTLVVFIVKNREEEIMLELEGKIPQELGLTSVKNAPSKTRNWATQPIG